MCLGSAYGAGGGAATLQDAYDGDTSVPQIVVNNGEPLTVDLGSGTGDVVRIRDAGQADIARFASDQIELSQPIRHAGSLSPAGTAYTLDDTFTTGGSFIGGNFSSLGIVTYNNAVFIWSMMSENKTFLAAAAPGFAAWTLFNALPIIANSGNFDLVQAITLNSGVWHERRTSGASTASAMTTINAANGTRATASGATITRTAQTGLNVAPVFSSVVGSTVNLGTIRGVHCRNPAVGFLQPQSGVETLTAYIGLDMDAIPFGGNVTKRALRSALTAATNTLMIENTGGAASDFGAGDVHLNDNANLLFGGTVAASDVAARWLGASSVLELFFSANSDFLRLSNPNDGQILFDVGANEYTFNTTRGFALGAQLGTLGNQFGAFVFGASQTPIAGEYSQFLLTQAGNLTVAFANMNVFGWTINAPSLAVTGPGSITTAAALNVGGNPGLGVNRIGVRIISNPSGGSGINAALWVTAGRCRLDGPVDINAPIALGGGAGATLGTIGGSGPAAAAQAEWVQIEVNGNVRWIPAWA